MADSSMINSELRSISDHNPPLIMFDLDGTLSDSAAGIVGSLRHAFATHGLPPLTTAGERALIGPPLHQTLPPLVGVERYEAVFATFKEHQDAGARLQTSLFPGVHELLDALRAIDVTMAVATSKHEAGARTVVAHLGIDGYFATVCGEQHGGPRDSKTKVVAEVLRRLEADPRAAVLVGDRAQDAIGAHANGIGFLGAGWGYAPAGELEQAGAELICSIPVEILDALDLNTDAAAS